jgi:hypothetical protein
MVKPLGFEVPARAGRIWLWCGVSGRRIVVGALIVLAVSAIAGLAGTESRSSKGRLRQGSSVAAPTTFVSPLTGAAHAAGASSMG